MGIKDEIKQKVIDGDIPGTTEAVKKAVESEIPAADILLEALDALESCGIAHTILVP